MAKKDIHPKYYPKATINCSCGAKFVVGSTEEKCRLKYVHNVTPFTLETKFIDTAGRLERYEKRVKKSKVLQDSKTKVKRGKKKKRKKKS